MGTISKPLFTSYYYLFSDWPASLIPLLLKISKTLGLFHPGHLESRSKCHSKPPAMDFIYAGFVSLLVWASGLTGDCLPLVYPLCAC